MTLIIARLFQFVVVFISYQLAITFFDPSQYGILTLFFVISSFFILLTIGPYGSYLFANVKKWEREGVFHDSINAVLVIAILIVLIIIFTTLFLTALNSLDRHFVLLGLYIFGTGITQTLISIIAIMFSIKSSIISSIINSLGCLLSSCIFIFLFSTDITNWLLGHVIFQCLYAMCIYFKYFYIKKFNFQAKNIINFFYRSYKFASITSLISILTWFLYQMPKVLYSNIFDEISFGVVMAGFVLAGYIYAGFESIVSMYTQTLFFRDFDSKSENYSGAWPVYLFRVTFCFTAIFMISFPIADLVSIFFLNNQYADSRIFLIIGLVCEYFRVIGNCFISAGLYIQRPQINIIPLTASIVFSFLTIIVMHSFFNFNTFYVVSVLPIGYVLYLLLSIYRLKNNISLSLKSYDSKFLILISSIPLYLLLYILMSSLITAPEIRLIYNIILLTLALILWIPLFSRYILNGRSILSALFSKLD